MQPVFTFDTFDEDDDDGDDDDDKVRTMMIVMMMMMMITMMMMMMMMMNIMMVTVIPGSYKCCNYLELCLGRCSFAPCTHTSEMVASMILVTMTITVITIMTISNDAHRIGDIEDTMSAVLRSKLCYRLRSFCLLIPW